MTKRIGFRRSIQVKLWWLFVTGMAVAGMLVAAVVLINSGATTSDPLRALLGVGVLIAAVATISLAGVFVRARIVAPIESLREGAAAFAAGNLAYRIHTDTGDELQSLAQEINDMSAALQQSQARLAAMAREREGEAEFAQARMREMTALIRSGRAITSLDLKDVLSRLAYEAARAVQGDRCSIYVLDSRQRRLVLRGEWEAPPLLPPPVRTGGAGGGRPGGNGHDRVGSIAYEWGEGVVGWVAQAEKPIFLANAQADKRFVAKASNDGEIAALIGVPVHSDSDVVGVLQASTRPGTPTFDVSDQRLLSTFAGQAAAAIKNSYLYEIERRRAKEMSIIAEIIRAISSSLDLDATLNSILSSVGQLVSYDLAEITLWDPQAEVLRTRGRGADPKYDEYSRTAGGVYRLGQGITGWVASHRKPLLLSDLAVSEVRPAVDLEQFPIRSVAGVPMISAQQLVGTIELASYTANAFNESHLDTLRTIAAQAAVAIQNTRLFIDSRRRAEEAAGLFRVAGIAASAQEPNEIMKQIMAEAAQLMGAHLGVVMLYRPETRRLEAHPTALFGAPYERVLDMKIDTRKPTFHHSVFRSRRVFRSDDAPGDRRILKEYRPFVERFGARRTLSAPLIVRDSPIGEVHIARTVGAPFDLDDEQRLMTLATLLAGVIETNRLAIEREERVDELEGLYEISQAISALTDLEQVYSQITRSIAERVGVEVAGVLLFDPRREMLVSQPPFYGVPDKVLEHYVIPVTLGSRLHRLWTEEDTWIINDVPNDPLTKEAGLDGLPPLPPSERREPEVGVERALFAAMKIGMRRIGVIQVSNKRNGQPFGEDDVRLMSIYAAHIAAVVENARLYAQTDVRLQQRVEELTALSNISQELNATLDRERILDLVLNEAVRSTGAARGVVALVEPGRAELVLAAMLGYTPEEIERARLLSQRAGEGIIGAVIETGASMVVDDVLRNPDYLQVSEQTRSELCVPIRYALEVVGAINLESPSVGYFTRDHVAFLKALAAHAAIAIGNTQRYEEQLRRGELLRRRAEQLANLFEIGQAFRSDRPLVEVLEDVVHAVQQTAGFNVVLLSVLEGDPPALERVAAAGLPVTRLEEMKKVRTPWESVGAIMHDAFRISQSHYVPAEHTAVTSELDTWPPFKADMAPRASGHWHEQDLLFTPLRASGDRILGIISVDEPFDGRVPDRATIETLELFANQAAIAIENARLLEDLQQRIDSLTLFNQVSRTISARLDLDGLLATIVDASIELTKANTATIFMRDDAGVFRPRKSHGWRPEQIAHLKWAEGEGLVGHVAREGHAVIVPDAKADPLFTPDPTDSVIGAMLLVPIAVGGAVIGVLSVDKPAPRSFSNTDLLMLSTLGDQAAIAMANSRLFDEVRRFSFELEERVRQRTEELARANADLTLERDRVETLYRITSELSMSLDLDRVLNRALALVNEAVGTRRSSILLVDQEGDRLIHRAAMGRGDAERLAPGGQPTRFRRHEGLAGWVIRNRMPAIVADIRADDRWLELPSPEHLTPRAYRSALAVPLIAGDDALGALLLLHPDAGYFEESHLRLVEAAATQAATAIHNAALYGYIRENAERLGAMLRDKQIEAAKAQAILESVADGVLVADASETVILFNAAAERILGRARETVLNRPTADIIGLYGASGALWEEQIQRWRSAPESRRGVPSLATTVHFEDENRYVRVSIAPVTGPGDEFLGTVSVVRDITAEVEADRSTRDFVSNVSHDLRTPMTSIKGYADLLLMGAAGALNENQERYLNIIRSNTKRLEDLVADLLDINRLDSGRAVLDIKHVSMAAVVEQVLTSLHERIEQKGLTIETEMPEGDSLIVLGDHARLLQVLTNLVSNSHQYTPSGGTITVRARRLPDSDMLSVEVQDTGIGISPEDVPKVFDRLFRADDPVVQEFPGHGLGLAITQLLVEMHSGEIWVNSELGKGTTFSFTVPLAEETLREPAEAVSGTEADLVIAPAWTRGVAPHAPRILVVEDDPDIASLIERNLTHVGYSVQTVGTGKAALDMVKRERPDLVTLDIYLPDIDGQEVLTTLKSDPETAHIPVIVVSVVSDGKESLEAGAIDFLSKPLEASRLIDAVSRVLGHIGSILIVEDDLDTTTMLTESLQRAGYRVMVTGNGRQAIALARDDQPDLILLDLRLPRMDGVTILHHLKRSPKTAKIPVVIMTGSVTLDTVRRQQFLAMGAVDFLAKPFDVPTLINKIESVLNRESGEFSG